MAIKSPIRYVFDVDGNIVEFSEFQATDFIGISDGGTGATTASGAATALGLEIGVDVQAYDINLDEISSLSPTDSNFIVGNGTQWVAESGSTVRDSLGLGTSDSVQFNTVLTSNLTVSGPSITLEGATDDSFESTLVVTDPTADRTITFQDASGIVALLSDVTAQDVDFAGDTGTGAVDLDSQTFTIQGTANEIETSASGQTLTIGLPNDVTIGNDLTITGNLTVQGSTTSVESNTVTIGDAILELNADETGAPSANAGLTVNRGTSTNVELVWDEANDRWTVGVYDFVAANFIGDLTGDVTGNLTGDVTGNVAGDLTGNVTATSILADGVTATTQSVGDNSTKVATTAYVDAQVATEDTLAEMNDVTLTSSQNGDFLRYNGSVWINDAVDLATDTVGDFVQSITAGDGLAIDVTSGEAQTPTLSVNVDDSSIEIDTDTLQVKALGITNAMLAGSIENAKLTNSDITFTDGTTPTVASLGDTITFTGGTGVTIANTSGNFDFSFDIAEVKSQVDEYAQDALNDAFTAGTQTRITVAYDDNANSLSYTVDDDLANYDNTNTAFIDLTDLSADVPSGITYNNATGQFQLGAIPNSSLTNSKVVITDGTTPSDLNLGDTLTFTGGTGVTITNTANTLDVSFDASEVKSDLDEYAQDAVIDALTSGTQTRITVGYDDNADAISLTVDDDLANYDNTNTAFIDLADLSVATGSGLTYNSSTGEFGTSAIPNSQLQNSSVTINANALSLGGTLTLVTDDIAEDVSPTNLWYTDARVGTYLTTNSYATETYVDNAVATENEISEMNDVTLTSLASGEFLQYNGSAWVNIDLDTDDIDEGSNLFYTTTRANTDIDARVTKSFVDALNVDADTLDGIDSTGFATSAQGALADSALQSGDNVSELVNDANYIDLTDLSGTSGVTYDNATGQISIGQAVGTTDNVTFNDVTVSGTLNSDDVTATTMTVSNDLVVTGDLTVQGTTTTLNTDTVSTEENMIKLASGNIGNSTDIGIYGKVVQSSTTKYVGLHWDPGVGQNKFKLFDSLTVEPTGTVDTADASYTKATLVADIEGDVTGALTGNASTATALASSQNFSLTGDVTATAISFDGTGAVALSTSVTESAVTQHEAALTITESQISDLQSYLTAETNDLTAAVTWANVPDANITQSSVTQHQAALAINESQITFTSNFLENLVEDTTPQLGGTLDANGNTIDMGVNVITDTKVGQWDTAYGWGDHSLVGYLTSETSHADVLVDGDFTTAGIMASDGSGTYSIVTDNSTNWNTAYGWGDHSTAGYLTSFTETNDLTASVTWANVPDANITESSVTQHQAALSITESQITDLGTYLENINSLSIDELSDIDTSTVAPTNGQALVWDNANSVWEPGNISSTLSALTDTTISSPSNGEALVYNSSTGQWENSAVGVGNMSSFTISDGVTSETINDSNTITFAGTANEVTVSISATDTVTIGLPTSITVDVTGNVTGTVSSLSNHDTDNLTEGVTNLYYSSTLFDTDFSGKTTTDLSEGTNLYYTTARFDTAFSGKDTDDLTEGTTNFYYTDARVGTYLTTNSYATESYVNTAVSNLVDSAPSTLDTLNELAAALGDDANFSTTVTNSIASKLAIADFTSTADTWIATKNLNDLADVGFADPTSTEDGKVVYWDDSAGAFGLISVSGLSGSGETNTASNIGTAGVGIFDGKVGEDLQFKKLNAGSAKITITDDTSNNEVDINLGSVSIDDLSDVDTTTSPPSTNQALLWNGSNWVAGDVATSGGGTEGILTFTHFDNTSDNIDLTAGKIDFLHFDDTEDDIEFTQNKIDFLHFDDVEDDITLISYTRLDDIFDVDLTSLASGDFLRYDASSNTWKADQVGTTEGILDFVHFDNTSDNIDLTNAQLTLTDADGTEIVIPLEQNKIDFVEYDETSDDINLTSYVRLDDVYDIDLTGSSSGDIIKYNASSGTWIATDIPTEVDAHLVGGTGVTYSAGDISIGQDVSTTSNVTFSTVTANLTGDVTGDIDGAVIITAKNESGSTISAGVPVYISGQSGSGTEFTVDVADADGSGTMPAIGITTASTNNNAEVSILTFGKFVGLNTSSFSVGDELYVSTSGTLSTTIPTGENAAIQKIAKVIRVHASSGEIFVQGAGRTNQVPNLNNGNIFIGNGSNQATTVSFNTTFDTQLATKDTDDISEGSTNLYYTDAKADARIAAASIDDLSDVDTTTASPSTGQALIWNGSAWAPAAAGGGVAGTVAFIQYDETIDNIALDSQGEVPFIHFDDTVDDIIVTDNILSFVEYDETVDNISLEHETINLYNLNNVSTNGLKDGYILKYSSSTGSWSAVAPEGSATAIEFVRASNANDYIEIGNNILPFYHYDGVQDNIPTDGTLSVVEYDGTVDNIDFTSPVPYENHIRDEDGTTVVSADRTNNTVEVYTNSESRMSIDNDGTVDISSSKLTIAGSSGNADQVLTTDGSGTISWADGGSSDAITSDDTNTSITTQNTADTIEFTAGGSARAKLDGSMSMEAAGGFFNHQTTLSATDLTIPTGTGTVAAGPLTITGTVTVEGVLAVV